MAPIADDNRGFTELVGTELSSAEEGRAAVSLKAEERHRHLNPSGTVHGGVISTLIDVSMAEALNTMTEEDEQPTGDNLIPPRRLFNRLRLLVQNSHLNQKF